GPGGRAARRARPVRRLAARAGLHGGRLRRELRPLRSVRGPGAGVAGAARPGCSHPGRRSARMAAGIDRYRGGDGRLPGGATGGARAVSAQQARTARVERTTWEAAVDVELEIDGPGRTHITTTVPFYDHMLTALDKHSLIDLTVQATGDTHIVVHPTVEDVANTQ